MKNPKSADFLGSFPTCALIPEHPEVEIAFLGRSNVGKSTLVNDLTASSLARVSSVPGSTATFNLYRLPTGPTSSIILCDLPGFGYAKFDKQLHQGLAAETVTYLRTREELRLVCLLLDIRRELEADERTIIALAAERHIPLQLILTKVDKLKAAELKERCAKLKQSLALERPPLLRGLSTAMDKSFFAYLRKLTRA